MLGAAGARRRQGRREGPRERRAGRGEARRGRGVVADEKGHELLMMRTHRAGDLRAEHVGADVVGVRVGRAPPRPRRRRVPRRARRRRARAGRRRSRRRPAARPRTVSATSGCCASTATVAARPEGTVNADLPTGAIEVGRELGRGAQRSRAVAVPARRPRRRRRGAAPAPPLPRPAARADAAQPARARRGEPRDARGDARDRTSSRSRRRC